MAGWVGRMGGRVSVGTQVWVTEGRIEWLALRLEPDGTPSLHPGRAGGMMQAINQCPGQFTEEEETK